MLLDEDPPAGDGTGLQAHLADCQSACPWLDCSGLVPGSGEHGRAPQQDAPSLMLRVVDVVDLEAGRAAVRGPARGRVEKAALPGVQDQPVIADGVVQRMDMRGSSGLATNAMRPTPWSSSSASCCGARPCSPLPGTSPLQSSHGQAEWQSARCA